jgi:hypothetical protein
MAEHYETARIEVPTRDAGAVETALDLAMRAAGYLQAAAEDVPSSGVSSGTARGERLSLFRGEAVVLLATSGAVALPLAIVLSTALGKTVEIVVAQGTAIGRDVTVTMRKLVVERGKVTEEPLDSEPFEHECSDREMGLLGEVVAEATEQVIGAHPFASSLTPTRTFLYARGTSGVELPERVQRLVDQLVTATWFSIGSDNGQTVVRGLLAGDVRLTTFLKPPERDALEAVVAVRPELSVKQRPPS